MGSINIQDIKKLRELTGVGMQDARNALDETSGDFAKAQELLRKKGAARAEKKSSRAAKQGVIDCYIHSGRVGVMLEVNCETDFVAKTDDFKNFVHEIALQIAASSPQYVARADVPEEVITSEKAIYLEQVKAEGKPQNVAEKIVGGKVDKFYTEVCLLDQPSIKDPKLTVGQLLTDIVSRLGENIVISRFTRYQLGEDK